MSCEDCSNRGKDCGINEKEERQPLASVPLASVESERHHRSSYTKIVFACFSIVLVSLILCVAFCYKVNNDCLNKVEAMNRYWLEYIGQYDFEEYSYSYAQDGEGINVMGDNNGVDYNGPEISDSETDATTEIWSGEGKSYAP